MTFREKLADWLTGGRYGKAIVECVLQKESADSYMNMWRAKDDLLNQYSKSLEDLDAEVQKYWFALHDISTIPVTPSSNGQTRKAVRIAKEALSHD